MIDVKELLEDTPLQNFMDICTLKIPSDFNRGDVVFDFTNIAKPFPSIRVFLIVGVPKYRPQQTIVDVSEYVFMNHRVPYDTCYRQSYSFDSYIKYPVFSIPSIEQEVKWARGEE